MTETYSNRYVGLYTVAQINGTAVTSEDGWTAGAPLELAEMLSVGDHYILETLGGPFGQICGWQFNGVWYGRRSDEQIEEDLLKLKTEVIKRHEQVLADNHEDYERREALLPEWVAVRMRSFHERGGKIFEFQGWGYELMICELAVLYDKQEKLNRDSEEISAYSNKHGTSGNQHEFAKSLVARHRNGQSLADTIAGLAPLTGDPFYAGGSW